MHTLEQKELEKATFKPNLNQFGKKLRKQVRVCLLVTFLLLGVYFY